MMQPKYHNPLNIPPMTPEKLKELAEMEDGGCISVGGLAVRTGQPLEITDTLDRPDSGFYDMEGKPVTLRQAMAIKDEKGKDTGGIVMIADEKVGEKYVRAAWLGDAFEDEFLTEKPAIPRNYGLIIATDSPFKVEYEFRCDHTNIRDRHKALVEAVKKGDEAIKEQVKQWDADCTHEPSEFRDQLLAQSAEEQAGR